MRSSAIFAALFVVAALNPGCAAPTDDDGEATDSDDSALYADKPFIWKTHTIHVCWENTNDTAAKHWVSSSVKATWEAAANIHFTGWGDCSAAQDGQSVRIRVDESRPRADIGNGVPNTGPTMWLNFQFKTWGTAGCHAAHLREHCIRAIAVHEFGHVLGFAHEQERPDTPKSCKQSDARDSLGADGIELGPYDGHSVMNYCNPIWNNAGKLSARDIAGVKKIYGAAGG